MSTDKAQTHLFGENTQFIEQLYAQYLDDPDSVDASWLPLFEEYFNGADVPNGEPHFTARSIFSPPVVYAEGNGAVSIAPSEDAHYNDIHENTHTKTPGRSSGFAAKIDALVRAYRMYGHTAANIDPLGRNTAPPANRALLDPQTHKISQEEMATPILSDSLYPGKEIPLGQIIDRLKEVYCGTIAVEYQHISDAESRQWLRYEIETNDIASLNNEERVDVLKHLVAADAFESFLHKQYLGAKRFSLTGGDALIPMIQTLMDEAGDLSVEEIIFGMAHRGRLNILHNIMGKPANKMLSEFEKTQDPEKYVGSSDVKYHMGYSNDHVTTTGKTIHLSMAFNPSHLEFVSPVVIGRVRAKQDRLGAEDAHKRIMPLLLHGDAAFAGQGIVSETFNLSELDGYTVGGTIHIVTNNQVGFTTNPEESRSTRYATGIAKMLDVPIFHVNGDDPEACARVAKLAMRFRQKFHRDVVIDLVCYRRYGHNEADEPRFTQPLMYQIIDKLEPVRVQYAKKLVETGVVTQEQVDTMWDERMSMYASTYEDIKGAPEPKKVDSLNGLWSNYRGGEYNFAHNTTTAVGSEKLAHYGKILTDIPEEITLHRTISRVIKTRKKMADGDQLLDWGMGEALAFVSLLDEGYPVRLTGQDCIRGTFSHRHAAVMNIENGQWYWPARQLHDNQGRFTVVNSLLSEAAVLGFEYGFSLDYPDGLTMWEAQFGDFVNGAQVIIDQFINSGEDKWDRMSGLVMLLPHGYEGQGPEHSSARLERFLTLSAEDNMYVCNLTTPAQYFHALRRQVLLNLRKPMILMSPKSLLRHKLATSSLEELASGSFQHVLPETRELDASKVKRVIMCSGKVYYDLLAHAEEHNIEDTALIRLEQYYPFDGQALKAAVDAFPNRESLVWTQEEPENFGAWYFLLPRFIKLFGANDIPQCASREASASPATGDREAHLYEQNELMKRAFSL